MDNLTIQTQLRSLSGIGQLGVGPELNIQQPQEIREVGEVGDVGAAGAAGGGDFKNLLAESIDKVNAQMNESDKAIEDLSSGKSANIHHTLIALQKADISFRMLLEVRNKVMQAYQDVMRMQT